MKVVDHVDQMIALSQEDARSGLRRALVPTMGYLHPGHLAHLDAVRSSVDQIIVSIFVNPTQFGPGEDFDAYPRDVERDAELLRGAGCDILFAPLPDDMYPGGFSTHVTVGEITERYEGAIRPDHFRGVSTVVLKLLNIVRPDIVTFGRKDAQQVAVVRRMMRDLNVDAQIHVIDTLRESDGLAMSSRNVYLAPDDRRAASTISAALRAARDLRRAGGSIIETARRLRRELSPEIRIDYADIVDPETFKHADDDAKNALAIVAGRVGKARLIDNMEV